jgi:hypothetical protein
MKVTVTFITIPASVTYDPRHSTAEAAVEDFFRALGEAEQAGFLDRQIIDIGYGGPDNVSDPETDAVTDLFRATRAAGRSIWEPSDYDENPDS